MLSKKFKIFMVGLIAFVGLIFNVNAREITLKELGEKVNPQADYVYIVGKHAFSSEHALTMQDLMLAARTISNLTEIENDHNFAEDINSDDLYLAMSIEKIDFKKKFSNGQIIISDMVVNQPLFGKSHLPSDIAYNNDKKVDIDYIDYEYVAQDTAYQVKFDVSSYNDSLLNSKNFNGNADLNFSTIGTDRYNVAGTAHIINNLTEEKLKDKSKYYFAYELTIDGANDSETITFPNNDAVYYKQSAGKYVVLVAITYNQPHKVIVDRDGEGYHYGPVSYEIANNSLILQKYSDASTISLINNISTLSQIDQNEINGYEYKTNLTSVSLVNQKTITGEIKEQTLSSKANYDNPTGYYILLKIEFPKNDVVYRNYTSKWKVKLYTKDEKVRDIQPTQADYEQGYIMVLWQLDSEKDQIKYEMDFDGDGVNFLPQTYTIDYTGVTFKAKKQVTFKYLDNVGSSTSTSVDVYEKEKITEDQKPKLENPKYHTFINWFKDTETKEFDFNTEINDNVTLNAHYNLEMDKYIAAKVPGNTKDGYTWSKEDSNITINVGKPSITIDSFVDNTNIASSIAEVLTKGEIKTITIADSSSHSKEFKAETENDKSEDQVKASLKNLFKEMAGSKTNLEDMTSFTLNATADTEKGFTVANTIYTFTFTKVFEVVSNIANLNKAIQDSKILEIYVDADISTDDTITVDVKVPRTLYIRSLNDQEIKTITDNKHKDGDSDTTSVFNVENGTVTFENLRIKGATRAITVQSGANVTANKVTAIDSADTAFDVKAGATFKGTELQYLKTVDDGSEEPKESYHYPTICGHGTISVTDVKSTVVSNYERIIHRKNGVWQDPDFRNPEDPKNDYYEEFKDPATGELKQEYKDKLDKPRENEWDSLTKTDHTHYYLNAENAKKYQVYFRSGSILQRFYAKGDEIVPPNEIYSKLSYVYQNVIKYDVTQQYYVHDGWSTTPYRSLGTYQWEANAKNEIQLDVSNLNANGVTSIYPRYVKAKYVVEIGDYIFGVSEEDSSTTNTIGTLKTKYPEFKKQFEALQSQAQEQDGNKVVDEQKQTAEVNDETSLTTYMNLIVGQVLSSANTEVELPSADGLSIANNKISGTIYSTTGNKFVMPVTFTSDNFSANSEIKVTDPNGNDKTYKYNDASASNIALASASKSMTIQLEAIKKDNITSGNKLYQIEVNVGEGYAKDYYAIDYNGVLTAEEILNEAAENTKEARQLKIVDKTKMRSFQNDYTKTYDKDKNLRLVEFVPSSYNIQYPIYEYTFQEDGLGYDPDKVKTVTFDKFDLKDTTTSSDINGEHYYYNGWRYAGKFYTSYGATGLSLLTDAIKESQKIPAMKAVQKVDDTTFTVTLTKARLDKYLEDNYSVLFDSNGTFDADEAGAHADEGINLTVKITNVGGKNYISEISSGKFAITPKSDSYKKSSDNKFNIVLSEFNNKNLFTMTPSEMMLGEVGHEEDLKAAIKNGQDWWSNHTGSTRYEDRKA